MLSADCASRERQVLQEKADDLVCGEGLGGCTTMLSCEFIELSAFASATCGSSFAPHGVSCRRTTSIRLHCTCGCRLCIEGVACSAR